jgi:hypothetical protein|tara:strand:+ start:1278 stop:1427 length:150 start_codon:yes stop_codon:yes gene_type:complete
MTTSHGPSKEFKDRILEECKRLNNAGEHIEASHLFRTYFPEEEKLIYDN